jgi:pimeloyl-ACP methyl ester carboxylesterase
MRSGRAAPAAALLAAAVLATILLGGCLGSQSESPTPEDVRAFDADEDGDFYRPPSDLVPDQAGRLIWVEPLEVPPGIDAWRILYTSESPDEEIIPVSGLVASPADEARLRPLVSFAHGTLGVGDGCAPSAPGDFRTLALFSLRLLAAQGWTVAATDYPGLGTPGEHPYLVGESEGRAVLDAARAARQLREAGAGAQVAVAGSSQGGQAALFAGELAPEYSEDLDLVGILAFAPPSHFDRYLMDRGLLFAPWMALGEAAVSGGDPASGLDSHDRGLLRRLADACSEQYFPLADRFNDQGFVDRGPFERQSWTAHLQEQEPGTEPIDAPTLLIQGGKDKVVPASYTRALFDRMCSEGDLVELRVYPDAGHPGGEGQLLGDSSTVWVPWLQDRFDGEAARSTCA